jgi:hypothetical protein
MKPIVLLAALAWLAAAPAAAAPARPAGLPTCALGRLPAALRTAVPDAIAKGQRRFGASLRSASASEREHAEATFAAAEAAYLYGMPTVRLRLTVQRFPVNQFVGIGELAGPEERAVVAPNRDTLYSVSQLNLDNGPLVIDAPATGGRYSVIQLLDAYTNDFAYIGAGSERDAARSVAVVPPGWQGVLPDGVQRIDSPTKLVWLLGRTLIDGPDDLAAAKQILAGYAITPLERWSPSQHSAPLILDAFPGAQAPVRLPAGAGFYDVLVQALAADPPPPADACALRAFAAAGIGPGLMPSSAGGDLDARALTAAAVAGRRLVDAAVTLTRRYNQRRSNGWSLLAGDIGRFGIDYAGRAVVADAGLGANTPEQALYPNTDTDRNGRPVDGRHDYVVTFPRGDLPPVRAFWSLTLYDRAGFFAPNAIDRYAIGDRTAGLRYGPGRSLEVHVSHRRQGGNWLPAPRGRFSLWLRLYEPNPGAAARWTPPTVKRVD